MSLNSILKQKRKGVIKAAAMLASFVALSFPMLAQAEQSANQAYEPTLENQRNPNEYCVKCHKLDGDKSQTVDQSGGGLHFGKFHGKHLGEKNPATGKPITCVTCHGNITENHRRGARDVMRFHSLWDKRQTVKYSPAEQNQVCFSCHKPEKLQEVFWAHDVHSVKLPCANCHTLHPEQDKMKSIQPKERVKLCVDCHSEQQKHKEASQQVTEQKDKK